MQITFTGLDVCMCMWIHSIHIYICTVCVYLDLKKYLKLCVIQICNLKFAVAKTYSFSKNEPNSQNALFWMLRRAPLTKRAEFGMQEAHKNMQNAYKRLQNVHESSVQYTRWSQKTSLCGQWGPQIKSQSYLPSAKHTKSYSKSP